jgi:hypothetical protein
MSLSETEFNIWKNLYVLCEQQNNSDEISKILSETASDIVEKIINYQLSQNSPFYINTDICDRTTLLFIACDKLNVKNVRVLLTHEKTKNIIDLDCKCTDWSLTLFNHAFCNEDYYHSDEEEIFNLLIAHHKSPFHVVKHLQYQGKVLLNYVLSLSIDKINYLFLLKTLSFLCVSNDFDEAIQIIQKMNETNNPLKAEDAQLILWKCMHGNFDNCIDIRFVKLLCDHGAKYNLDLNSENGNEVSMTIYLKICFKELEKQITQYSSKKLLCDHGAKYIFDLDSENGNEVSRTIYLKLCFTELEKEITQYSSRKLLPFVQFLSNALDTDFIDMSEKNMFLIVLSTVEKIMMNVDKKKFIEIELYQSLLKNKKLINKTNFQELCAFDDEFKRVSFHILSLMCSNGYFQPMEQNKKGRTRSQIIKSTNLIKYVKIFSKLSYDIQQIITNYIYGFNKKLFSVNELYQNAIIHYYLNKEKK